MRIEQNRPIIHIDEVSKVLGVDTQTVIDFINCGDLNAIGTNKNYVKRVDLDKFLGGTPGNTQDNDCSKEQGSCFFTAVSVEDISDKEWNSMKQKEHKPYYDERRERWCIALSLGKTDEGKRIRKIITGRTQPELWSAYVEYMKQQEEVAPVPENAPIITQGYAEGMNLHTYSRSQEELFSDRYCRFLEGIKATVTSRTYGQYVTVSKHIVENLGHLKMYEINKKVIQSYLEQAADTQYQTSKDKAPAYYSQRQLDLIYTMLHRFIRDCTDESDACLKGDIMSNMKKPQSKASFKEEVKPYSRDEINMILKAVRPNPMIYCWVSILAEIGCRPSEALALQFSDFDFESKKVSITKTLGKEADFDAGNHKRTSKFVPKIKALKNERPNKKQNYQRRSLRVSDNLLNTVLALKESIEQNKKLVDGRKKHGTTDFLFTGSDGGQRIYEDYTQLYDRLLLKAGISPSGLNLYRFRHTVCTDLLRSNKVDIKTIQLFMGDNTTDMLLRVYANIQKEDVLESSYALSERMNNILG